MEVPSPPSSPLPHSSSYSPLLSPPHPTNTDNDNNDNNDNNNNNINSNINDTNINNSNDTNVKSVIQNLLAILEQQEVSLFSISNDDVDPNVRAHLQAAKVSNTYAYSYTIYLLMFNTILYLFCYALFVVLLLYCILLFSIYI